MNDVNEVALPLSGSIDPPCVLHISLLPRHRGQGLLLDLRSEPDGDAMLEPVQLVEGAEYRYRFELLEPLRTVAIVTDKPDLFEPDDDLGHSGRLRTGLHTGLLVVQLFAKERDELLGRAALEVRSRKLDYLTDYRLMLHDIAECVIEAAVLQRFAPTEQRFVPDETRPAAALYQRFAFLRSLLAGDTFAIAMQQIRARPHRTWVREEERRPIGRGAPATAAVARQMGAAGPRIPWPSGPLPHLPTHLPAVRTEESLDTAENRFVRFVLERWRDLAAEVGQALQAERERPIVQRGLREVAAVTAQLDALLADDLFADVGPLRYIPTSSPVLQRQAGYRELLRAHVQMEAAASLTWEGGEEVYGAGQRDVAVLYEFWVFMRVADLVAQLCGQNLAESPLFVLQEEGVTLRLKRNQAEPLVGEVARHGRRLQLELYFNRVFGQHRDDTSWSLPMRPDCSLRISPHKEEPARFEEIWLHFDAKYRLESLLALFGDRPANAGEEDAYVQQMNATDAQPSAISRAGRTDLLKMHAYRDAIRRSAGAYVIYPGDAGERFTPYREILPGLGAFALRPTETEGTAGLADLRQFLEQVLDHAASQATQYERSRYWLNHVYEDRFHVMEPMHAAPFLERPPADTLVLLGYVRSKEQLDWIHRQGLYNLRADGRSGSVGLRSRELAADLVVLYGSRWMKPELWRSAGAPELYTGDRMRATGYHREEGHLYYCIRLEAVPPYQWPPFLTNELMEAVRKERAAQRGVPVTVSWLELLQAAQVRVAASQTKTR